MRSRAGKVRLKSTPAELRAAGLLLDEALATTPIDLAGLFGNDRPVEAEIGPGKGTFVLRRAARRAEINFLGIEWVRSYACYVADRARRAGVSNVRVLCADAETVFRSALPDRCLWRVHIYFPDPWPKRRHLRRRLVKPPFVHDLRRVLKPGGWVGIITDSRDYFWQIRRGFSGQPGLAEVPFRAAPLGGAAAVGTNFEVKYTARGRTLYTTAAIRYA